MIKFSVLFLGTCWLWIGFNEPRTGESEMTRDVFLKGFLSAYEMVQSDTKSSVEKNTQKKHVNLSVSIAYFRLKKKQFNFPLFTFVSLLRVFMSAKPFSADPFYEYLENSIKHMIISQAFNTVLNVLNIYKYIHILMSLIYIKLFIPCLLR